MDKPRVTSWIILLDDGTVYLDTRSAYWQPDSANMPASMVGFTGHFYDFTYALRRLDQWAAFGKKWAAARTPGAALQRGPGTVRRC